MSDSLEEFGQKVIESIRDEPRLRESLSIGLNQANKGDKRGEDLEDIGVKEGFFLLDLGRLRPRSPKRQLRHQATSNRIP